MKGRGNWSCVLVALLILCARVDGLSGVGVGVRWGGKVGVGRCVVVVVVRSSVLVVAERVPVPVPVLVCTLVPVPFLVFVVAFTRVLVFIHVLILLLAVSQRSDGGSLLAHYAFKLVKLFLFR
jgi:hypothetical protein